MLDEVVLKLILNKSIATVYTVSCQNVNLVKVKVKLKYLTLKMYSSVFLLYKINIPVSVFPAVVDGQLASCVNKQGTGLSQKQSISAKGIFKIHSAFSL